MAVPSIIKRALETIGIEDDPTEIVSLSGGCIHDVRRVRLGDGHSIVCKCSFDPEGANQLHSEKSGLEFLASLGVSGLMIPEVLGLHVESMGVVLLMSWLEPGSASDDGWVALGRGLAAMHSVDVGQRYGFHGDNHIGSTPQINDWKDDWVVFNEECRLRPQLELARKTGLLGSDENTLLDQVIDRLGDWIPARPKASPLHGDLWSGNVMHLADGGVAVIDPACSIGDAWADVAMMALFGGVPRDCFDAYAAALGSDLHDMQPRLVTYQLYHVLNHVNLFGSGYLQQLTSLASRLLAF